MSTAPKTIKYLNTTYVRVEGSPLRLVKKFQGRILTALRGQQVAKDKEFAIFKLDEGFEIVHLPTKFSLNYLPFGHGIGQTSSEPYEEGGKGYTVTETEALTRAKEILQYYLKYSGMKTSISQVTGSMRVKGPNYLAFLSAD